MTAGTMTMIRIVFLSHSERFDVNNFSVSEG